MKLSTFGRSGRRGGDESYTLLRQESGRPASPRRMRRDIRFFAVLFALASLLVVGNVTAPAYATDYPTWEEVQAAKGDVEKTDEQIARIKELIAGLATQATEAAAVAQQRGEEYQAAQLAFDEADRRASEIQRQADESAAEAEEATQQAGRLAAQLYRSGGNDLSVNILLEGQGAAADQLLSKLGSMSKMVERSSTIYDQAQVAKNTAQALGDQAEVARTERETLRIEAEGKLQEAMAAQETAEAALAEQEARSIELDQQLLALQDKAAKVVTDYEEGVAERERVRKEEEKAARERALREQAEAAKDHGDGGQLGGQGWAKPAGGRITDNFGPRQQICTPGGCSQGYHSGTDLGAGCGAGIYAASSGTVTYAGWSGTYGNYITIDHGDGVQTGYAHIRPGGIHVGWGQQVNAGQNIASVGTTGASDGCHLHFEVRINGSKINPVAFMGARGVWLG